MEALKKKRDRTRAKLNRCIQFGAQINLGTATAADVKVRFDLLTEIWTEFDAVQTKLECESENEELENLIHDQEEFEDEFCKIKAKLMTEYERLSKVTSVPIASEGMSARSIGQSSHVKLPAIELPTFAGEYQQWASFSDLFISVVHDNPILTSVQKLHYLKTSVRGPAAKLLGSIAITDANYSDAWKLLEERFSNKRQIINSHLQALYYQPKLTNESARDLRSLLDITVENVRALKSLGLPTQHWDCLLVFLVSERLDTNTRHQWELSVAESDNTTFSQLKEFIERRCRALEVTGTLTKAVPAVNKSLNQRTSRKQVSSLAYHAAKPECSKCSAQHPVYKCEQFLRLSVEQRIDWVKSASLCYNCLQRGHTSRECKSSSCKRCRKPHNTLLHREDSNPAATTSTTIVNTHQGCGQVWDKQILLATASVIVSDSWGNRHQLRVLLDSGSQATFITENCVQQLCLKRSKTNITIGGLGGSKVESCRGSVHIRLSSLDGSYNCQLDAIVLARVTNDLPPQSVDPSGLASTITRHDLTLADANYYKPGKIDLLLGADVFYDLMLSGKIKDQNTETIYQNTKLGWVISGPLPGRHPVKIVSNHGSCDLSQQLRTFWEMEELHPTRQWTSEELECERHFQSTHSRDSTGRFIVQLPFHNNAAQLGDTRLMASKRLIQIEQKLQHNPTKKQEYYKFMNEYISLGHMEPVSSNEVGKSAYYLPHHYVIKESSTTTKLRVVFDGSAKPSNGISLNEALLVGPTIQEELVNIIIRFRVPNVVYTADITKMYRQIQVHPDHWDFQRILWHDLDHLVKPYHLKTVTYGTATAPFLAVRCLMELANAEEHNYPIAAAIIRKDFYVDDVMSGANTVEEAIQARVQLVDLLSSGGFELRKWTSNNIDMLQGLPEGLCSRTANLNVTHDATATLGVNWHAQTDQFHFKVSSDSSNIITKRTILSQTSKLFDPLGWLAPVVLKAKIIIQKLWLLSVDWDQSLPSDLVDYWKQYQAELPVIEQIRINRQMIRDSSMGDYQLHGFSDASEQAYGAVVFIRSKSGDVVQVQIVCSKSRVAPLKRVTLPRLELCGALLLARLLHKVRRTVSISIGHVYAWTDSTIVLSWLNKNPHAWKTFVANRVTEIQDLVPPDHWRHVASGENPADCLSRGLSPSQIQTHSLWWNGPAWLLLDGDKWPISDYSILGTSGESLEERKSQPLVYSACTSSHTLLDDCSSLTRLVHVTAFCNRFIANCRTSKAERVWGFLKTSELDQALLYWIRQAQGELFGHEITSCKSNKPLNHKSTLLSLNPFLDNEGILRVGGRLQNANLNYNQKHPIILPHHHKMTNLIIEQSHTKHLHAGPQLLMVILRNKYWIIRARQAIRSLIHRCIKCFRNKTSTAQQLMGSLPLSRLHTVRAFLHCGIDYAGPINIKPSKGRGNAKSHKAYVCIFICFSTRAIHIELVNDLSTTSFIAALRRFTARRGRPTDIYSDCGSNFVGANRELKELNHLVTSSGHNRQVSNTLADDGISWHFSPPASPHFGGLWEAGVKSIKYHLRRTVGLNILTYDEMYTVLTQIEACLNSWPLSPLSDDPNDFMILTPGHFLIGDSMMAIPDQDTTHIEMNRLTRWRMVQKLYQQFWKQWSQDYLNRLQQRPKWAITKPNLEIGDLVLLKENNISPLNWPMARIVKIHPGKDDLVRVVTLKTQSGEYKRPVAKCCALPLEYAVPAHDSAEQVKNIALNEH